jgi:hypothetical protein
MSYEGVRFFVAEMEAHRIASGRGKGPSASAEFFSVSRQLDSASEIYASRAKPIFASLRDIASQVAGLLVLSSVGNADACDHPMRGGAVRELTDTIDCLRSLGPTQRTKHFHDHLLQSSYWVGNALQVFPKVPTYEKDGTSIQSALESIKRALTELRSAARFLPGFEVVDIGSGCCACCNQVRLVS